MQKPKIAIIGASYLQLPLIEKAKSMGLETHVFAWKANDVGETAADFFYPISIVEKEQICAECARIGIDAVCSIASDLAAVTVNHVANELSLAGNSAECTYISTNKAAMREAFAKNGDPSPKSVRVGDGEAETLEAIKDFRFPLIVKPTDRSGSRGVTKLTQGERGRVWECVELARRQSLERGAVIEEFAQGDEYSVECASFHGEHTFVAITKKYTTGAPHFIETGHLQPGMVECELLERVKKVVFHALDTLGVIDSISHSELKIDKDGNIAIIEIGARMGGDCIGSELVPLSTGVDFMRACIDIAFGRQPSLDITKNEAAAVRYIFSQRDLDVLEKLRRERPELLCSVSEIAPFDHDVSDSSRRFGCYVLHSKTPGQLAEWLPAEESE